MLRTIFRGADVPPGERFAQWCEVTGRSLTPARLMADPEAFDGEVHVLDLVPVRLTRVSCHTPLLCWREPVHIRRSDPEEYRIALMLHGSLTMNHARTQHTVERDEALLYGTWHPYECTVHNRDGTFTYVLLQIPRAVLPLTPRHTDQLLGQRLSVEGAPKVLSCLVTDTLNRGKDLLGQEAAHLGTAVLELASALLAREAGVRGLLTPETRRAELMAQVRQFIDRNIGDPALSPSTIAAAHHISVRYLQRLFENQLMPVSAFIRQQRLEGSRRDLLANPAHSIQLIAARWGFTRPADFSRAFRATFGIAPRDYRNVSRQSPHAGAQS